MKMKNSLKVVFTSMMIVSGLAACDSEGPAEKAGKKIDQVTENVSDSVSNAAERADQAVTNLTNTTEPKSLKIRPLQQRSNQHCSIN